MRQGVWDGKVTVEGVKAVHRNGKTYWYLRRKGKIIARLPDPKSPDFLKAYTEACESAPEKRTHAHGTIGAAVEATKASDAYLRLSATYRASLIGQLDAIAKGVGGAPLSGLRKRHIKADARTQNRLKAWRLVCKFAVESGWIEDNPSEGVKLKRTKTEGHPAWTPDEIETFRARWPVGSTPRLCFEVLFWTGARVSDAVGLNLGQIGSDGVLAYRQSKTGHMAYIPWSCDPPSFAGDRSHLDRVLTGSFLILESRGRQRSIKGLSNTITKATEAAGFHKTPHGLRKTRASLMAENGATAHQIASWTGHITLQEVSLYTAQADRRKAVRGTEQDQNTGKHSGQKWKTEKS